MYQLSMLRIIVQSCFPVFEDIYVVGTCIHSFAVLTPLQGTCITGFDHTPSCGDFINVSESMTVLINNMHRVQFRVSLVLTTPLPGVR